VEQNVHVKSPLSARASLLQVLIEGPAYGSALMARFRDRVGGRARLAPARVYPVLRALEAAGLVRAIPFAPRGRRGARTRVYYVLTVRGRASARAEREMLLSLLAPVPRVTPVATEKARMVERVLEGEAASEAGADLVAAGR
jgi:DNA-binding PadR family transcriptional regulator